MDLIVFVGGEPGEIARSCKLLTLVYIFLRECHVFSKLFAGE